MCTFLPKLLRGKGRMHIICGYNNEYNNPVNNALYMAKYGTFPQAC